MKKTRAMRLLEKANVPYETVEYNYDPDNLDVTYIAAENDLPLTHLFKTLALVGDKTGILLAMVAGSDQLNLKKLASLSGNKKVQLLPVKDLLQQVGYQRGACSPIGTKKEFPVFLDSSVKSCEHIYFNAGRRGILLKISSKNLVFLSKSIVISDLL